MTKEREVLEVDVLFVGAGPAALAGAIKLAQLQKEHNKRVTDSGQGEKKDLLIAVIEKATGVGKHNLSGAVLDPRAIDELIPNWRDQNPPIEAEVSSHEVRYIFKNRSLKAPLTPPPLANKGRPLISLSKFTSWMGKRAEALGANLFDRFPAKELLWEDGKVAGVRCQERGLDKEGKEKGNYEPGAEIRAPITVLAEGTRGSVTKELIEKKDLLNNKNPQGYALGIKEVWKVKGENHRPGHVSHTLGFPLGLRTFGGGFIYHMKDCLVSLGMVVSLDYRDPFLDPYEVMQQYKTHPYIKRLLAGGERVAYGAKTIPEGGYYALPKLAVDGCIIIGDAAGFVNSQRIKGIHLAIKSGAVAADVIWEALEKRDFSAGFLSRYEERMMGSWAGKELRKVRNFHQAFHKGFLSGMIKGVLQYVTRGRGLVDPIRVEEDAKCMETIVDYYGEKKEREGMKYDGALTFDRDDNLFFSGTEHEEDQPCHLEVPDTGICYGKCLEERGNPCQYFCPAKVYEFLEEGGERRLRINFANCLHCKTCDIKDPYGNIIWHPPEAGGGPQYKDM